MAEKVGSVYIDISAKMGSLEADLKALEAKLKGVDDKGKQTGSSLMSMGKMIAGAGITGAVIALGTAALKASAQMEQNRVAFTTMLGSADKAKKLLEEMTVFAANTPFELPQIVDGGKKLLAFGFAAKDIIPTLTKLGDVSAALGIPIGELSDIYGKMKVQGVIQAEELNQLAGRGIPVFTELAKVMGTSADKVKKLGSEGKISFKDLEQAFTNMTAKGSQFGGMMEAQSKTLAGQWSNFNDAIGKTLNLLGDEMSPAAKAILTTMSLILNNANEQVAENKRIRDAEIERLKNLGDIEGSYILQNGLIGSAINALNGTYEKEYKISQIKQEQEKIDTVLLAHKKGTITLSQEALTALEANTRELERQDSILKGTNEGWAKQTGAYKTLNDFLAQAAVKQEEGKNKTELNAAAWKKMTEEAKKFSEELVKQAGNIGNDDPVVKIQKEMKANEEHIAKVKKNYLDRKISDKEYNDSMVAGTKIRIDLENQLELAQFERRKAMVLGVVGTARDMAGQFVQLAQMEASNKTANIDNELKEQQDALQAKYDADVAAVNASVGTQEEKDAKLKALDEKKAREEKALILSADKEKRKIARDAAILQKKLSIFDVLIKTPQAAMAAFSALAGIPIIGPFLGAAAAAATVAMGAKQIQLINDAPLPALAMGGIVPPTPGGNQFTIGEAGSAEAVIPLNDQTLGRLAGMINGAGGERTNVIQLPKMSEAGLYNMIWSASQNGDLFIAERAVISR